MNKLNHYLWPADATTLPEKIAYIGLKLGVPALFLFMQLSAFNVFHNFYSIAVGKASPFSHVGGFVLSLFAIFWTYESSVDSPIVAKSSGANTAIIIVSVVLAFLVYAGFFTATY